MNKPKNFKFLPIFTLCFCLGICLVKFWYIPFIFLYAGCAISIILSLIFLKQNKSVYLLLISGIFLGSLILKNYYILPAAHILKFTAYKSDPVLLKGVVCDIPQISKRYTHFVLEAKELTYENKIYRVTGKVLVRIFRKEEIHYGQEVILEGRLSRPYGRISDRFSYRDYLRAKNIYSILMVSHDASIKHLGFRDEKSLKAFAYRLRNACRKMYFKYLPPAQAGIFCAILLGDRSQISPYFRRLFVQTGTVHILARQYTKIFTFAL